jgi:hypothetical protein
VDVEPSADIEALAYDVRLYVFNDAAATGQLPQPPQISRALRRSETDVRAALERLAAGKVLIMAPTGGDIWAANPFCAVPSGFRVHAGGTRYWGICIWDAMGIAAALGADARITAPCGDCGDDMAIEVRGGRLHHAEGLVHFAVPAHHWWNNIAYT